MWRRGGEGNRRRKEEKRAPGKTFPYNPSLQFLDDNSLETENRADTVFFLYFSFLMAKFKTRLFTFIFT
jgi:hypothetical protein